MWVLVDMVHKISELLQPETLKFVFTLCVGAFSAYVGLYHSVNNNELKLEKNAEWVKSTEKRLDKIELKIDTKLEKISDTLTDIKIEMAKGE